MATQTTYHPSNLKKSDLFFLEEEEPGSTESKTKSSFQIKKVKGKAAPEDAKLKLLEHSSMLANPLIEASKLP